MSLDVHEAVSQLLSNGFVFICPNLALDMCPPYNGEYKDGNTETNSD